MTSDSLLFWSSDYNTNHKRWLLCAEVLSAVGDLHGSIVTKNSFDLWRTKFNFRTSPSGTSRALQVSFVRGDVRTYGEVRINAKMRVVLIDWLVDVAAHYKCVGSHISSTADLYHGGSCIW